MGRKNKNAQLAEDNIAKIWDHSAAEIMLQLHNPAELLVFEDPSPEQIRYQDEHMLAHSVSALISPMARFTWLFSEDLHKTIPAGPTRAVRLLSAMSFDHMPEGLFEILDKNDIYKKRFSLWFTGDDDFEFEVMSDYLPAYATRPIPDDIRDALEAADIVNDMEIIWRHAIYGQGRGEEMASRNLNFNGKKAASKLRETGRQLGVNTLADAYFSGVPLADVVGCHDEYERCKWVDYIVDMAKRMRELREED